MMRNEKELRKEELIKKETRRFILSNYDALRAEARSGRGEHIASLASLSGLDNEDVRQMCADATSAVLLAETVTERYEEEKGGDHSFSKLADGEN